jgi:hypothetical protein
MFLLIKIACIAVIIAMSLAAISFLFRLFGSIVAFRFWFKNKDKIDEAVKESSNFFKFWSQFDEVNIETKGESK